MGMPTVTVTFTEKARTFIERSERAIVGLILKDTVPATNPIVVERPDEVPTTGLTAANIEAIKLAMMGCDGKAPTRVIAYVIATNAANYSAAFEYFDTLKKLDYIAIPTVETDSAQEAVAAWITSQRAEYKTVKAVLPNYAAGAIGVINFATASMTKGDTTYTTEKYCARIAGLVAACPLTESVTYKALTELDGCTKLTRTALDTAVDAGKLVVFWDGEKVKIARGVNSLTQTSATMGDQFKKIHVVEIMDMILNDIRKTVEDHYIGRYTNSYDNKCLLLAAVGNYLSDLERQGLIRVVDLDIDIDANKQYLQNKGTDVSDWTDAELRQAATGDKVFLRATINIYDAIEDIVLPITV